MIRIQTKKINLKPPKETAELAQEQVLEEEDEVIDLLDDNLEDYMDDLENINSQIETKFNNRMEVDYN